MLWLAVFVLGVGNTCVRGQSGLLVSTTQGLVQGTAVTDDGGYYYGWYGIPYAGTTAGLNRFKPPTPAPTFIQTFNATVRDVVCTQPGLYAGSVIGTEDCLRLSIFTAASNAPNNIDSVKPVLVWIVGEEYATSRPLQHSLRALVEQDLTVVAVNYRLSVFGFLCLGIENAPGNAGLRDIIQALTWIHNNIRQFGGNPANVVLFGHGSGAAMAELLTLSPLARGLMNRVIAQSGSALSPGAVSYNPIEAALTYAREFGFRNNNITALAEFYRTVNQNLLISILSQNTFRNNTVVFAPCIENQRLNPNNTVLTDAPINLIRFGNYSDVDFLASYTNREGTIRADQAATWIPEMNTNFNPFLPADLSIPSSLTASIRNFYFNISAINIDNADTYLRYHGDVMVLGPVIRGVKARSVTSNSNVYLMEFAYRRINNNLEWPYPNLPLTGAPHGALLDIILGVNLVAQDFIMQNSILLRYKSFIDNGEPVYNSSVVWYSVTPNTVWYIKYEGGQYGNISGQWTGGQSLQFAPEAATISFWDDLYSRFYVAPQPVSIGSRTVHVGSVVVLLISAFVTLR